MRYMSWRIAQTPTTPSSQASVAAADLYCDVEEVNVPVWRAVIPGLVVALLGTLAAGSLADRYGAPLTLMALLVGLALNFLSTDTRLEAGLNFASRTLLRWGIVLTGFRVTLGQVISLGPVAAVSIVLIVALTITVAVLVAKRNGQGLAFGVLAGGAVAICGASAAMAVATTLGERRASKEHLALILVGVSLLSAGAMMVYPVIAGALGLSDRQAGFFFGASIHDVAQALGAGFSYSDNAGRVATIVKLTRVALLAPVLAVIGHFMRTGREAIKTGLPWYVIGFFVLACVNSIDIIPPVLVQPAERIAAGLLSAAITAVAIRAPLSSLIGNGWRPLLAIVVATIFMLASALAAASYLIEP